MFYAHLLHDGERQTDMVGTSAYSIADAIERLRTLYIADVLEAHGGDAEMTPTFAGDLFDAIAEGHDPEHTIETGEVD